MNTKLTLRLDEELIRRAKSYSTKSGKSLSRLVADYFATIEADEAADASLPPRVRSLLGALAGSQVDEQAYRCHLERKHE